MFEVFEFMVFSLGMVGILAALFISLIFCFTLYVVCVLFMILLVYVYSFMFVRLFSLFT